LRWAPDARSRQRDSRPRDLYLIFFSANFFSRDPGRLQQPNTPAIFKRTTVDAAVLAITKMPISLAGLLRSQTVDFIDKSAQF
jgi:hypothetical protein